MKSFKLSVFILVLFFYCSCEAYSQAVNQWGGPVWGAKLSISLSNSIVQSGSTVFLKCITTNFSTNGICFVRTYPQWMYEVSVVSTSGKSLVLAGPEFMDDGSYRTRRIGQNESYECLAPLVFDRRIEPGRYKVVAKQDIGLFRTRIDQPGHRGQLVSNILEVQVK